jgi:hypothetical protein
MTDESLPVFQRRKNNPESFDSICAKCFHAVGNRSTEAELKQDEDAHVCESDVHQERFVRSI